LIIRYINVGRVMDKPIKESKYKDRRQVRRISLVHPVIIETEYGNTLLGHTVTLSMGGAGFRTVDQLMIGEKVIVNVLINSMWWKIPCKITYKKTIKHHLFKNLKDFGAVFIDKEIGSWLWLSCIHKR